MSEGDLSVGRSGGVGDPRRTGDVLVGQSGWVGDARRTGLTRDWQPSFRASRCELRLIG
jgi:hypothetical protein